MKYAKGKKPTWREVLDTNNFCAGTHIDEFVQILKSVNYELMLFNGYVWELENDKFVYTGWSEEDLE